MAFYVVLCHFWAPGSSWIDSIICRQRGVAVPIFFIISFYLTYRLYYTLDLHKFKKRLWRLIYPFFTWALIYYCTYLLLYKNAGIDVPFSPKDLLWQMLLGSDRYLCPPMWYQFDLIIFTGMVFVTCKLFPKYKKQVLVSVAIFAIMIQYSNINVDIFGKVEYELKFPLGRLAECFPLAIIGYYIADFNLLDYIKMLLTVGFVRNQSEIFVR